MMYRSHLSRAASGRRKQPWYVGGASAAGSQTIDISSLTGGYWSAAAEGDLVVVCATCYNAAQTPTISTSGYTTIVDATQNSLRAVVAYKRMGASPDTSVTVTNTDYENTVAWVFRGVSAATPLDATTTTAKAATLSMDNPAITTATGAAIVLAIGAYQGRFFGASWRPAFSDLTAPVGMVALRNQTLEWNYGNPDDPSKSQVGAAMIAVGQASAYNPAAWTTGGYNAAAADWIAATVALRPA